MPKRRAKSAGAKPKIKKIEYPKWYFEKERIEKDYYVQEILRDNRLVKQEEKLEEIFQSNNFIKKNNHHKYILNLITIKEKRSKLKTSIKQKNEVDDLLIGMEQQNQKLTSLPNNIVDVPKAEIQIPSIEIQPEQPFKGIPCIKMQKDPHDNQMEQIQIESINNQLASITNIKSPVKSTKGAPIPDIPDRPLKKPDTQSSRVVLISQIKKLEATMDFVVPLKKPLKVKFKEEPSKNQKEEIKQPIKNESPPKNDYKESKPTKPEPVKSKQETKPQSIPLKVQREIKQIESPQQKTDEDNQNSGAIFIADKPNIAAKSVQIPVLQQWENNPKQCSPDQDQIRGNQIQTKINPTINYNPNNVQQPNKIVNKNIQIRINPPKVIESKQPSVPQSTINQENEDIINNDSNIIPPKSISTHSPDNKKKIYPTFLKGQRPQSQTMGVRKSPAIRQNRTMGKSGSKRETYASIEYKKTPQQIYHKHDKWWANNDCWFSYCQMHKWKESEELRQSKLYFLSDQESQAEYEFFKNLQRQKYLEVRMQRPRSNYSVNYLELSTTAEDTWQSKKKINLSLTDAEAIGLSKNDLSLTANSNINRIRPQSQRQKKSEQLHLDRYAKTAKSLKNKNERFKTQYKQYFTRY